MSSIAARVREFVKSIGTEHAFTRARVLECGAPNAVDIELCRLVKNGVLKRLALGVFMLACNAESFCPSMAELARIKAERFGKQIFDKAKNACVPESNTYFTDGCRSSFKSVHGIVKLKHLAAAKRLLPLASPVAVTAETLSGNDIKASSCPAATMSLKLERIGELKLGLIRRLLHLVLKIASETEEWAGHHQALPSPVEVKEIL